jgi:uncharacterized protein YjbI with pentapeptide repeats
MSEQQATSACPHPEAVGKRWGDPISEKRQAELQGYLDRWSAETDHGERKGPFDKESGQNTGVSLTGADVSWLDQQRRTDAGTAPHLHLGGAYLGLTHLEGATLSEAHLERAHLASADLEGAYLVNADLEGADLGYAYLERAYLGLAHLEGASLYDADLEGADLSSTWLDSKTVLSNAHLDDNTKLRDIHWNGVGAVDLTSATWDKVSTLGDEYGLGLRAAATDYEAVVRAYRQVAAQLRAQGVNEVADRFLYRSQKWQRRVLLRQGQLGSYLFSVLLAALSGYGYRIWRIFATYALTVAVFAAIFYWIGIPNDPATTKQGHAVNALLVSLTAIHGRTFFEQFAFTVQGWVAAIESIVGIVIEGVFVAMLIQRFFGR